MRETHLSCERIPVFLQVVHSIVDSDRDGREDHVEAGLRAETRRHLDHCV